MMCRLLRAGYKAGHVAAFASMWSRRGLASRPVVVEFIELAREQSRVGRTRKPA